MQPFVAALILVSALLHAAWNAVLKRQRDPRVATIAILAVATALAIAAVPFTSAPRFPQQAGIAWALLAGLGEAGYFVTLALALRKAPLGIVYTVTRGGALVAVWPLSVLLLGESVSWGSALGALAVCVGLVFVGLRREGRVSALGIFWAIACALFVAGYHVCYKCALETGASPSAVFAAALGLAFPISIVWLGRCGVARVVEELRAHPRALVGAGVLCTASFLVFLVALAQGGAGAVMTLRNASVLFALVFAWAMGERPDRRQIAGTLAVVAGAVALGWPR